MVLVKLQYVIYAYPPVVNSEFQIIDISQQPNEVAGTKKAAPMPEPEKGAGLEGVPASGGSSQGLKQGSNVGQGS